MITSLLEEADRHLDRIKQCEEMELNDEDWVKYELTKECDLCHKYFNVPNTAEYIPYWPTVEKCRHHAHMDTKYRGRPFAAGSYLAALCQPCNLSIKDKKQLFVLLHNASAYDNKLIVSNLDPKFLAEKTINCLARNRETFICLEIDGKLRITDSANHLRESLDKLTEILKDKGIDNFK